MVHKSKKSFIRIAASISAVLLLCTACGSISGDAGKTDETHKSLEKPTAPPEQQALSAYAKLVSQEKCHNEEEDISKPHFAIADLNSDGVPECIISEGGNLLDAQLYYTFEGGNVVELEIADELYPMAGGIYIQPERGSFIFFRGGPAYEDYEEENDEDRNGYMPYMLLEHTWDEKHKIHTINDVEWQECVSGKNKGEIECWLNGKPASIEDIKKDYQWKENLVQFLPNTAKNREACGVNEPAAQSE